MGTYHLIDGAKVRVVYPGNIRTCGRCHQSPSHCPGGGTARECAEQGGVRLPLIQHMRQLWERVGLTVGEQLFDDEDEDESVHSRRQSPLLGEKGIEPTPESHDMVPGAQERLPLGEIGIEPTPESSGPGAQGTPFLPPPPGSPPSFPPPPVSPPPVTTAESEESTQINMSLIEKNDGNVDTDKEDIPKYTDESPSISTSQDKPFPSNSGGHDLTSQKISQNIQEKVEIFEADDSKRKAETSPELSKKEKKKLKNQEKYLRKKLEHVEKVSISL